MSTSLTSASIDAITLFTEDLDRSQTFYATVFGLPMIYQDADSAVYKLGSTMINLLKTPAAHELIEPAKVADPSAGARLQFTIGVDDVDAACAELADLGVTPLNGPMDRPWGIRTACVIDPSGHIWELAADLPAD